MKHTCSECGQVLPDRDGIRIDPESSVVSLNNVRLPLNPMMARLFTSLYERRPRFVTSDTLFDDLYGLESDEDWPARRILNVYVTKLRRALEGTPFIIENAHSCGWRLVTKDKQDIRWV